MLVHVDTESWQSEINLITLLSETKKTLRNRNADIRLTQSSSIINTVTQESYSILQLLKQHNDLCLLNRS